MPPFHASMHRCALAYIIVCRLATDDYYLIYYSDVDPGLIFIDLVSSWHGI